jgi:hypothetical protein
MAIEASERLKDPKFYLEKFCKIKGKTPGLIPFILNEPQKDLFNTLNLMNRIIILKARQMGFSTAATGWIYHKTITTPGTTSAIIGYNSDLTKELLDKVKMFYNTTPPDLRPTIQYNSKFEISFPKINSKILVLPSTENVGRGYTLHNVLATELAMWDKAEEKMVALENSVPIDGKIIIESTPNGVGNLYHKMWVGDNDYTKKEYGWWWLYDEEHVETIRRRMNNPQKFAQEYGLEFLASGRPVFDQNAVTRQRKNILKVGDQVIDPDGTVHTTVQKGDWRFYKKPNEKDIYVFGVDTSEGVTGGDYSVAVIFNRMTGEEVGMFRGIIAPDKFAEELNRVGREYNNAMMVVESNNHGLVTITVLKQLFYPTLYFRPAKFESISSPWSDKLGWKTTVMTRPLLIDDLNKVLRDAEITLHSKEILDEMNVFIYDKTNAMTPQEGFHDDCIFATGIAYQGFKVLYDKPLNQLDYEDHLPSSFNY